MKNRNTCLDFLRGLLCISIVLIHIPFPGTLGKVLSIGNMVAVPFFFMTSGYYAWENGRNSDEVLKRRALKMIKILVEMFILYGGYCLVISIHYNNLEEWVEKYFNLHSLRSILLFNNYDIIRGGQFWFFPVLIECYILLWVVEKWEKRNLIYKWIPLFLLGYYGWNCLVDLYLAAYDSKIGSIFIFSGWPFFILGNYFAFHFEVKNRIPNGVLLIGIATEIGYSLLSAFGVWGNIYIFRFIVILGTASLFLIGVKNSQMSMCKLIEKLGRRYSMYVYLFHILVMFILQYFLNHWGLSDKSWVGYFMPIAVVCISIMGGIMCEQLKRIKRNTQ